MSDDIKNCPTPFIKVQPPKPAFLTRPPVAISPCEHEYGAMYDKADRAVGVKCARCGHMMWSGR